MSGEYKMATPPVSLETATPSARSVLEKAKAQVGFIPNMYLGMANQPVLLETYLDGYERFRSASGFTPSEQEVVFLAVSRRNACGYCMAAHSMLADRVSKVPAEVTAALRGGEPLPNLKLEALRAFTDVMVVSRGLPGRHEVERFLAAGYQEQHILSIVLAIAVKTMSNYSNHLFDPRLDDVFASHVWQQRE